MSKKTKIKPLFKCRGGKFYLNQWIIGQFPQDYASMNYIEPFCGSANILLNKDPSQDEIINDADSDIILIMRIIRDQVEEFAKNIKKVKYKEATFKEALEKTEFDNEMEEAVNEFILRSMSRGGLKKTWSERLKGDAWKDTLDQLPEISQRFQNIYIMNRPAIEMLRIFDNVKALAYIDPPLLPDKDDPEIHKFEMKMEEHMELADVLNNFKGKVLISGHPSRLYNRLYKGWTCETKKIVNSKINSTKIELLWRNF